MCIFCKIIASEIPSTIIYEDDLVLVILDISQATKGHSLVIPKQHYENFWQLPTTLLNHTITITQQMSQQICLKLQAEGCNILTNIHEIAGQSVFHCHLHIMPRYRDDDLVIKPTSHQLNLEAIKLEILDS